MEDRGYSSSRRPRSPHRPRRDEYRVSKSHSSHHAHHKRKHSVSPFETRPLPFNARRLDKRDLTLYEPLLASYLDIQKGIALDEVDDAEAKGRWKSFVKKWNRGELAEGWYEPATLQKALASAASATASAGTRHRPSPTQDTGSKEAQGTISDDDDVGPLPPPSSFGAGVAQAGPAIPSIQDLELRHELTLEEAASAREALHAERRMHNTETKERLDELQPRAEPGTKERQLEKKRELAATNRQFAQANEGGEMADVPERDLMGDDADGLAGFKRQKREADRRKSEREIKREEIMRARQQEREEKAQVFREREQQTMKGLLELAKKRFG